MSLWRHSLDADTPIPHSYFPYFLFAFISTPSVTPSRIFLSLPFPSTITWSTVEHILPLVPLGLHIESLYSDLLAPLCPASLFYACLHYISIRSDLLTTLRSSHSSLIATQLWFICSYSSLIAPIYTDLLDGLILIISALYLLIWTF